MLPTLKFAPLILTSAGIMEPSTVFWGIYSTGENIASSLVGFAVLPPSLTNMGLLTVTFGIISLFIPVLTTNVLLVFTVWLSTLYTKDPVVPGYCVSIFPEASILFNCWVKSFCNIIPLAVTYPGVISSIPLFDTRCIFPLAARLT